MRYIACVFATLLLAGGAALIAYLEWLGPTLELDQQTVQALVDQKMPFEGKTLTMLYRVDQAKVQFQEDGHFAFKAQVKVDMMGRSASGIVTMSSGLNYLSKSGSFYLNDVRALDIDWQSVKSTRGDQRIINRVVDGLSKLGVSEGAVAKTMAPYTARLKESLDSMAKDALSSVQVYRLNENLHDTLAASAISDVSIHNGKMVLSLSWASTGIRVLVYSVIGLLLLAISGALFRFAITGRSNSEVVEMGVDSVLAIGEAFLD